MLVNDMDNIGIDYDFLKSVGNVPNIMDEFIRETIDREQAATALLYLSTAIREHITIQECILRYEPQKIDEDGPRIVSDFHSMTAERLYYETKIRLVRRDPIDIESDVVKHALDCVAKELVEVLRKRLKL